MRFIIIIFALSLSLSATAQNWETDYGAALTKAKEENKSLLLNFTGSDWCGWCMRLDREVFSQEAFKKYAEENLVLVKLDFPKRKKLSEAEQAQNQGLAQKHGIRGFPTILLLNADQQVLLTTGYRAGGPEKYVEHLAEKIK
jgi:protein disulfide-isomerase